MACTGWRLEEAGRALLSLSGVERVFALDAQARQNDPSVVGGNLCRRLSYGRQHTADAGDKMIRCDIDRADSSVRALRRLG